MMSFNPNQWLLNLTGLHSLQLTPTIYFAIVSYLLLTSVTMTIYNQHRATCTTIPQLQLLDTPSPFIQYLKKTSYGLLAMLVITAGLVFSTRVNFGPQLLQFIMFGVIICDVATKLATLQHWQATQHALVTAQLQVVQPFQVTYFWLKLHTLVDVSFKIFFAWLAMIWFSFLPIVG